MVTEKLTLFMSLRQMPQLPVFYRSRWAMVTALFRLEKMCRCRDRSSVWQPRTSITTEKLDLAMFTGSNPSSVAVINGNGDGTFQQPSLTMLPASIPGFPFIVVADFNRDGKPDLAAGPFVLLGSGDGTFRTAATLTAAAVLSADFNQDGIPDLLTSNSVFLGKGDASFSSAIPLPILPHLPNVVVSTAAISGDVNNDGINDLVESQSDGLGGGSVSVALGIGNGMFQPFNQVLSIGGSLAALDLNGDGNLDLVAGGFVLPGNGNDTFRAAIPLAVHPQNCLHRVCGPFVAASVVNDFNGDGLPEFALAYTVPIGDLSRLSLIGLYINDSPGDGILVSAVSAASGYTPVAPDSIVSAFGINMAPTTEAAPATTPPPTSLGGIRLHIGTALAPLFYVSPTQINYLLPLDVGAISSISIERIGYPYQPKGFVIPESFTLPGLFTLPGGVAAATAVRVAPDSSQTPVPVSSCANGTCVPVPIDVSGDPVYLSLYGTGFSDGINGIYGIGRTVCNGTPTSYFGPQGVLPGLSQINWLLPSSLPSGNYFIVCQVVGSISSPPPSNAVLVSITH